VSGSKVETKRGSPAPGGKLIWVSPKKKIQVLKKNIKINELKYK
jgi:hypothetical protein